MVVFEWFERFFGAVAAPDDKYQPSSAEKEESPLWSFMAPDPNFSSGATISDAENAPPPAPSPPPAGSTSITPLKGSRMVECQHCHRMTPSSPPAPGSGAARPTPSRTSGLASGNRSSGADGVAPSSAAPLQTPPVASSQAASSPWTATPPWTNSTGTAAAGNFASPPARTSSANPALQQRMNEAVRATFVLGSPGYQKMRGKSDELLGLIFNRYTATAHKRLAKLIEKDPRVLLYARVRSANPNNYECREGFTALHLACNKGNEDAVKLMLKAPADIFAELVQMRTKDGESALLLASQRGHTGIITLLREFCESHDLEWQSRDAHGRTPLGAALMSSKLTDEQKASLRKALQSPDDPTIFGLPIDPAYRSFYLPSSKVIVGISEMPGERGGMEDATLVQLSAVATGADDKEGGNVVIAGVLDGHEDGGKFSEGASDRLRELLMQHFAAPNSPSGGGGNDDATIQDIFQAVDDTMKLEEISGGTTACVAIVTDRLLRVANVGDSRCVLLRRVPAGKGEAQDTVESVENRMEQLSLSTQFEATYSVLALSEDHKPSLPCERKRIERAGLTVVESRNIEASRDDSRIRLNKKAEDPEVSENSNNTELAMSRSLGDYEFKSNKALTKDQQAVIAVPEIVTRERSPNDELLIVACDGIWDVMTNARAAEFVVTKLEELGTKDDHPLARVAELLCRECHSLGSADNLSVVLVALGETAERMTPAYVSSPAATTTTDSLPRKLEYESPLVEDSIQEAMDEDTIQDQMVDDDTIQEGTGTPAFSGELQPTLRTPGQVQTL